MDERWERHHLDYVTARFVANRHVTRTTEEARVLLDGMVAEDILVVEEVRRPTGGHVERRYRHKCDRCGFR